MKESLMNMKQRVSLMSFHSVQLPWPALSTDCFIKAKNPELIARD